MSGGGVIWNMGEAFDRNIFRAAFDAKGRLSSFVTPIPIYLIKHRWPALVGLSAFARWRRRSRCLALNRPQR